MEYLPINLHITGQNCLVVGGGNIALRKSKQLIKAGAVVTIVATDFHPDFLQLQNVGSVKLVEEEYQSSWLNNQMLVIAATDNNQVNLSVYNDAESQCVFVNVVDQPALCRFIMPSVIDRTPLTIAISSGGAGPVLARMLREKIEWLLPDNVGEFLSKVKKERSLVAQRFPDMNKRRSFWESFFERTLGWSVDDNLANAGSTKLDLNYNLTDFESDEDLGEFAAIQFNQNIDDLTVGNIKQLQKADEVYLTNDDYGRLKDLIRRDANIHFQETNINTNDIPEEINAVCKNSRVVIVIK